MLSKYEQQTTLSKQYFPNCLTLNSFYENDNFEKKVSSRQQKHEKLPSMQRVENKQRCNGRYQQTTFPALYGVKITLVRYL